MELFADGSVFRYRHHEHFRRAVAEGGAKRVRLILAGPLCKMSVAGDDGGFCDAVPDLSQLEAGGVELAVAPGAGAVHQREAMWCGLSQQSGTDCLRRADHGDAGQEKD